MRLPAAAVIYLACAFMLHAAEPKSDSVTQALINDLGSENFDVRQQAQDSIEKMGEAALSVLIAAADAHENAEVRVRSRVAVKTIELNQKISLALSEGGPERLLEMAAEAGRLRRYREMNVLFARVNLALDALPDQTDDELSRVNTLRWKFDDLRQPDETLIIWTGIPFDPSQPLPEFLFVPEHWRATE